MIEPASLGEVVDHACVIVDGIAGRFGQNSGGARQITALHIPGEVADLHSVVQPKGCSALQALSTVTILRVPHSALRAAAGRHPAIAEAFWRDTSVDAAILSQWVVNVGRRDAKTRLAHLLCEMATRYKAMPNGSEIVFQFPVTQCHLADATGLTPVHVNRTLKALRDAGVVTISDRTVHILDWDELARLGEFDSDYLQADIKPEERLRIVEAVYPKVRFAPFGLPGGRWGGRQTSACAAAQTPTSVRPFLKAAVVRDDQRQKQQTAGAAENGPVAVRPYRTSSSARCSRISARSINLSE